MGGSTLAVDYAWVNSVLKQTESTNETALLSFPIFAPLTFSDAPVSQMDRFQGNPVIQARDASHQSIWAQELTARARCNLYKTAVRMSENVEMRRLLTNDLGLLNLAIRSREQKFKTSHESHLSLMGLQNERSLAGTRLLVLSNRWRVLVWQADILAPGATPPIRQPVVVSLTASIFSKPNNLIGRNLHLRMLGASNSLSQQFSVGLTLEVRRLIAEINNLAAEYSVYSDEIQLRRQESVAAALAAVEAGRLNLADAIDQKRKLIQDGLEMAKIRRAQHELLADLVYLCGARSYEELINANIHE